MRQRDDRECSVRQGDDRECSVRQGDDLELSRSRDRGMTAVILDPRLLFPTIPGIKDKVSDNEHVNQEVRGRGRGRGRSCGQGRGGATVTPATSDPALSRRTALPADAEEGPAAAVATPTAMTSAQEAPPGP